MSSVGGMPPASGEGTGRLRMRCAAPSSGTRRSCVSWGFPLEMKRVSVESREEIEAYQLPRHDFFLPYLKLLHEQPEVKLPAGLDPGDPTLSEAGAEAAGAAPASFRPPGTGPPHPGRGGGGLRSPPAGGGASGIPPGRGRARSCTPEAQLRSGVFPDAAAPVMFLEAAGDRRRRPRWCNSSPRPSWTGRWLASPYRGMYRDQLSQRRVQPWGLLLQWGHWYLVGMDEDRGERRGLPGGADGAVHHGGGGGSLHDPGELPASRTM